MGRNMAFTSRRTGPSGLRLLRVLLPAAACCSGAAVAGTVPERVTQHLTDLVIQALPMGQMADADETKDPTWPLKDKASRVSSEQLRCLREQLSSAGYRNWKLQDVRAYAATHVADVDDDIKVLESGAAWVANRYFMGALEAREKGTEFDRRKALQTATASQMIAYTSYEYDPKFAALRDLVGIGSVNDPTAAADERARAIKVKMMTLNMDLMYRAMGACKVAPAVLL